LHELLDPAHLCAADPRARDQAGRLLRESAVNGARLWRWARTAVVAGVLLVAALCPVVFSTYFTSAVMVVVLWTGLAAASLSFLAGYGGMVSLGQMAPFGVAGFMTAKLS